jgi:hypothetical protein
MKRYNRFTRATSSGMAREDICQIRGSTLHRSTVHTIPRMISHGYKLSVSVCMEHIHSIMCCPNDYSSNKVFLISQQQRQSTLSAARRWVMDCSTIGHVFCAAMNWTGLFWLIPSQLLLWRRHLWVSFWLLLGWPRPSVTAKWWDRSEGEVSILNRNGSRAGQATRSHSAPLIFVTTVSSFTP